MIIKTKIIFRNILNNFPLSFLISFFLIDEFINRIFIKSSLTISIYPLCLLTFFIFYFNEFSKKSKIILLLIFFTLYISSYSVFEIGYFVRTVIAIFIFYIFKSVSNNISKNDLLLTLNILRSFIYFSFIIFLITYLGLTEIGIDYDNVTEISYFGPRLRCIESSCFPVFRSLITNSNYFVSILLFTIIFISKYQNKIIFNNNKPILGKLFQIFYIDKILILIMAFFADSRIYFLAILIIFFYDLIKNLLEKKLLKNKINLLILLFPSLFFVLNIRNFLSELIMIKGLLYIPKTIAERSPSMLDLSFPITFFGNGFGTNWAQNFSFSSEYLVQTILIDFGFLGLIFLFIFLFKIFFDSFYFIKNRRNSINEKFLKIILILLFLLMIFKASSDLRNFPLAILIGFFYPKTKKQKKLN